MNKQLMVAITAIVAISMIGSIYADSSVKISVHQDLTSGEQKFIDLLNAGIRNITYTVGVGITYFDVPEAYGEETELTIKSPFNPQSWGCTLTTNSTNFMQFDCSGTWKSGDYKDPGGEERTPNEDGCNNGMDIDIRTGECRPFEDIQEEARAQCDADPECPSGYYNPTIVDPLMPDEDSDRITDQELIKKINALIPEVNCYQGRGTTDGVQEVRDFPIPVQKVQKFVDGVKVETYELDLSTSSSPIQIRGYYATIVKAAFECHAQNTLQNDQGGVLSSQDYQFGFCDRYAETLTVEQSIQAGCGMTSGSYYRSLHADVPIMTQEMANQKANFGIEKEPLRQSNDYVCSNNYTESLRDAYGCPPLPIPEKGNGKIPTMQDYHNNVPGEKYTNYLTDGGDRQAKNLAKDIIQKKIAELQSQLRGLK